MSEPKKAQKGLWGDAFLLVPLFLLLYFLSTGPVARYYHGKTPPKWVITLYYPVQLLYEKTPLHGPLQSWVDLWQR